jgi:hypothetical protein
MEPDELLTHLESELARCGDERDRLRAELEAATVERDRALLENSRLDRMLLTAEHERDWLRGELLSVVGSKSWILTRPLRRMLGSDRPESVDSL